jgi:hypothetical protein
MPTTINASSCCSISWSTGSRSARSSKPSPAFRRWTGPTGHGCLR